MTLSDIAKNVGQTISQNSPVILTGLAVAGVASTAFLAVRSGIRVGADINARALDEDNDFDPTWKDLVKEYWQEFLPPLVTGIVTAGCIIGANTVNTRRQAALIGAYSISETAFKEYREKAVEYLGPQKELKMRDEIAQDRVNSTFPTDGQIIIIEGKALCHDQLTDRYFDSSMETLRKAENDINFQCFHEAGASQNDFYSKIGLGRIKTGDDNGWNIDHPLELQITTVQAPNGMPALSIGYKHLPRPSYYNPFS